MIHAPKAVDVTLSRGHLDLCRAEADRWRQRAVNYGDNSYNENAFSRNDANYTGAIGELATSYFTDLPTHFGEPYVHGRADVGLIEVRTRTVGKPPILRVYEKDPHPITVLATIRTLTDDGAIVRLHGWILTQIAWSYGEKKGEHWKRGVEYHLGENFLRPMTTLVHEHKKMEAFYEFQSG
jgi:hypothetical protein